MINMWVLSVIVVVLGMSLSKAYGVDINSARAKFNYQMLCQGCHTPDGDGVKDVPTMKDFIGHFLATKKGREYLVRVPGSANSALSDAELAEVLNWIIIEMGGRSVPTGLYRYTAAEVGKLRQNPLFEVINYRKALILELPINSKQNTK